jgi:hypothetical protein
MNNAAIGCREGAQLGQDGLEVGSDAPRRSVVTFPRLCVNGLLCASERPSCPGARSMDGSAPGGPTPQSEGQRNAQPSDDGMMGESGRVLGGAGESATGRTAGDEKPRLDLTGALRPVYLCEIPLWKKCPLETSLHLHGFV